MNETILEDLGEMDRENLVCGFIHRSVLAVAVKRAKKDPNFRIGDLGIVGGSTSDRILADELNAMIRAAKEVEAMKK